MRIAKKKIKQAVKKMVAVLLAVSMCVPSNLLEVASATSEDSASDTYTVTLAEAEHGTVSFTDSSESEKTYSAGDEVSVSMTADDGYQVSRFTVTNTDTGAVVADMETTDDIYSFTMPAKNLTVSGTFTEAGTVESSETTEDTESTENAETTEATKTADDAGTTEIAEEDEEGQTFEDMTEEDKELEEEAEAYLSKLRSGTLVYADMTDDEKWSLYLVLLSTENTQQNFASMTDADIETVFGMTREEQQADALRIISDENRILDLEDVLVYDTFDTEVFFGITEDEFGELGNEAVSNYYSFIAEDEAAYQAVSHSEENTEESTEEFVEENLLALRNYVLRASYTYMNITGYKSPSSKITTNDYWKDMKEIMSDSSNWGSYNYYSTSWSSSPYSCAAWVTKILDQLEKKEEIKSGKKSKIATAVGSTTNTTELLEYFIDSGDYVCVGFYGTDTSTNVTEVSGDAADELESDTVYAKSAESYKSALAASSAFNYFFSYSCNLYKQTETIDGQTVKKLQAGDIVIFCGPYRDGKYTKHVSIVGDTFTTNGYISTWDSTMSGVPTPYPYAGFGGKSSSKTSYGSNWQWHLHDPAKYSSDDSRRKRAQSFIVFRLKTPTSEPVSVTKKVAVSNLSDDDFISGNSYYKASEVEDDEGTVEYIGVSGAKYTIYTDAACTTVATYTTSSGKTKNAVLKTNSDGTSNSITLDAGTYYIKETKVPKGFKLNTEVKSFTLTAGETTKNIEFTDEPVTTSLGLTIDKKDEVTDRKLTGAVFKLVYYSDNITDAEIQGTQDEDSDSSYSGAVTPRRTWYFETKDLNRDGEAELEFNSSYYYGGDQLYTLTDNSVFFPLGTYALYEETAPDGFVKTGGTMQYYANGYWSNSASTDGGFLSFKIVPYGDGTNGYTAYINVDGITIKNASEEQIIYGTNYPKLYGLSFNKLDYDSKSTQTQGDATNLTMSFAVYNVSGHDIWYDANQNEEKDDGETIADGQIVFSDTTAADGSYTTPYSKLLSYGIYRIVETGLPTGYNNAMIAEFDIDVNSSLSDNQVEGTIFSASSYFEEPVIRGGFAIEKSDSDAKNSGQYNNTDGSKLTQNGGDMTTTFTLTNLSINAVYLDMNNDGVGETYLAAGGSIDFTTNTDGIYASYPACLPYGRYRITEKVTPPGYDESVKK